MTGLPKRFPDRTEVAAVRAAAEPLEAGTEADDTVRVAGRVMARRGHGKLVFLDVVDRSGRIQVLADTSRTGELDLDLGDVVGVSGHPAQSRRGEPSLAADEIELLAKNRSPLPDTFHGLADTETRYRKRYLDLLMNEETREEFLLRGRIVAAIRRALDEDGFSDVPIVAYSAKFASAFYGPFREAAGSTPAFGDRRGYQMDPANGDEALREVRLDVEEGADVVMVKPALPYLDVIRRVKDATGMPVAAYNVSGEYAMVKAAAAAGHVDERAVVLETLTSIRRAGADIVITYHAKDAARWLQT
jgi:hypothetical protein